MTPGRLIWLLRRDYKRGLRATYGDYALRRRIWNWRNPVSSAVSPIPVHIVCGAEQLDLCAWTLASWTNATDRNWSVFLHDDGSLPPDTADRLRKIGLRITLIAREDADIRMRDVLSDHPHCTTYRNRHPLGLKIFDTPAFCQEPRYILLDTDLAFFQPPKEILEWVDSADTADCWFNRDASEASNISPHEAFATFGVHLWPRVNSGLCLLNRSVLDPEFCEDVLARSGIRQGHFWRIEQTLFAMCASRHAKGGLLPDTYEVSLGANAAPDCIMRHYVGAVRNRYYAEACPRLVRALL